MPAVGCDWLLVLWYVYPQQSSQKQKVKTPLVRKQYSDDLMAYMHTHGVGRGWFVDNNSNQDIEHMIAQNSHAPHGQQG